MSVRELNNQSRRRRRMKCFVMDGKLSTIYSAGALDTNGSSTTGKESRYEFLEKLQRAKVQVPSDKTSQPILSSPGAHCVCSILSCYNLFLSVVRDVVQHDIISLFYLFLLVLSFLL
eukprot:sb/3476516/